MSLCKSTSPQAGEERTNSEDSTKLSHSSQLLLAIDDVLKSGKEISLNDGIAKTKVCPMSKS